MERNPNVFLITSDKTCVNLATEGLSLKSVVSLPPVEVITGSSVEIVSKQGVVNFRRYASFSWGGKRFNYRFVRAQDSHIRMQIIVFVSGIKDYRYRPRPKAAASSSPSSSCFSLRFIFINENYIFL